MKQEQVCGSSLAENSGVKCPVCDANGQKVKKITVENMVKKEQKQAVTEEVYHICLASDCDVVYFNQTGDACFFKQDLKVPVWFKEKNSPKPICYCKDVSDSTIIKHVVELGHRTLEEIQEYTGANTGKACLVKNPTGR